MTKPKRAVGTTKGKMPRISVSFPAEIYKDLERIAGSKKVSVAWVVREAVERYLASEAPLFHQTR